MHGGSLELLESMFMHCSPIIEV